MYDEHYGLSGRPFQLTPDPKFWFDTATHRKAMAYLGYGLSQGEGFIVITGDIGAGKTTLVGHLMATIDRERLHAIKLVSTQIEADDLLRIVGAGLDIDCAGLSKAEMLTQIERGLHLVARSGRRTLLIVDEAQALHTSALEELRMLSNFQAGGHALLQIFLLGQPEFRERLNGSSRLEQLRQRVIATHHLDPMGAGEVAGYIHHRLNIVGWAGRPSFTDDAFAALYAASDGVPRRLNQLTGRVLLLGAIEQLDVIDAGAVASVVADMSGDVPAAPVPAQAMPIEAQVPPDAASAVAATSLTIAPPEVAEPVAPLSIMGDLALAATATAEPDPATSTLAARVADLDDQLGLHGHRLAALREQIEAKDTRIEALGAQI
ncbi:MAG: general secretion pathway protein GspA, partial [Sphingomonas sp.]|nr:general secretion pathway protein GspA [Sphingomonas sp.]